MELRCEHNHVAYDSDNLQKQCRQHQHDSANELRAASVIQSNLSRLESEISAERVHSRNGNEALAELRDALLHSEGQVSILRTSLGEFHEHLTEAREASAMA